MFLGVGSDEILDLIQRVAAAPGKDEILICPPTYGMYSVCAAVNDLKVVEVPLVTKAGEFSLDVDKVRRAKNLTKKNKTKDKLYINEC